MDESAALGVLTSYFNALRAEIVQRMSIQSAMLGAKITFISAAVMYVFSNTNAEGGIIGGMALCLPAAAILFDYLYIGQELAIRGVRDYLAEVLEPEMARLTGVQSDCLWETCLRTRGAGRATRYGTLGRRLGNEGLSVFVIGLSVWMVWGMFMEQPWLWGIMAVYLLVLIDNALVQRSLLGRNAQTGAARTE